MKKQPPFEIQTQAEERAYRLGYLEGWASAQVIALRHPYQEMRAYQLKALWPWLQEEPLEIGASPPSFPFEINELGKDS